METSTSTKEIQTALNAFQRKALKVGKDSENPGFKRDGKPMRYASLTNILETALPVLSELGLSVAQFPDGENGLTTRLMHESGEWMQATGFMKPTAATPQAIGSTITYARRYGLAAVLGLMIDDDDDGNAGSATPTRPALASEAQKQELTALMEAGPMNPETEATWRTTMHTVTAEQIQVRIDRLREHRADVQP